MRLLRSRVDTFLFRAHALPLPPLLPQKHAVSQYIERARMIGYKAPAASGGRCTCKLAAAAAVIACCMLQGLVDAQGCSRWPMACGDCDPGYYYDPLIYSQCPAGTYKASCSYDTLQSCLPCSPGSYNPAPGSTSSAACDLCLPGTYCLAAASQQCRCPINSYAPNRGASACSPCPGQAVPTTGQSVCETDVAVTSSEQMLYKCIIGIFAAISLGSVCLVVILVCSHRAFSTRPFHSGICAYIASFAPYALLKAVAVGRLLDANTQEQQQAAELMLNGSFMLFFWLGFGGKMALIQLWMHLISRHTIGESEPVMLATAHRTWRLMRVTVVVVCVLYGIGFVSLVGVYGKASSACAATAHSTFCIPMSSSDTPPECKRVVSMAQGIVYYEGAFAAVVVIVFTFYAVLFNGLVYAMLTSDTAFSSLTELQRMLISNSLLRRMLRPYAHARALAVAVVALCISLLVLASFRPRGGRRRSRLRATWSSGATACERSASSSPSSA